MINNISEGVIRAAAKIDASSVIHDKEVHQQKAEDLRQARPVEDSESGGKAETQDSKDRESSKYYMDEHTLVFEKYNKDGDVVLRIPPSHKPVDQRA